MQRRTSTNTDAVRVIPRKKLPYCASIRARVNVDYTNLTYLLDHREADLHANIYFIILNSLHVNIFVLSFFFFFYFYFFFDFFFPFIFPLFLFFSFDRCEIITILY